MLVTRHFDTEQSPWSTRFEATLHRSASPRMSNYDSSLSTQPDWQGHYSFLPPVEGGIFGQSFEPVSGSANGHGTATRPHSSSTRDNPMDIHGRASPSPLSSPTSHQRDLDPLGLRQPKAVPSAQAEPDSPGADYAVKAETILEEAPLASSDAAGVRLEGDAPTPPPLTEHDPRGRLSAGCNEEMVLEKEEDEEVIEDDDLLEGDGEGDGEGGGEDMPNRPQTAAERTAARRKMKRFRLTHQQTRFLMSEFAKQPHPDAAHRERLSREIPGLSSRQVQVWFQNRRAKIKRMTADDRDRMIKMRAVPDDFDNVQALHSPYGAVHSLGAPITPPVDFGSSSYTDHIIRPLLDTMRRDNDDHISPTGLSPAFSNIGFSTSGSMSSSDILSPLSPTSTDRGYYAGHLAGPLGGGSSRTPNPFARQNSLDSGVQLHSQSRQQVRPLQPLSLRETMSRSRSDNLHSPLRTSMSWKGDAIDYASYASNAHSSGTAGRHPSIYPSEPIVSTAGGTLGYDAGSYTTSGLQPSTTNINYSSLQQPSQSRTRLRAASATLPLGLDLRHQYRTFSSSHSLQGPSHSSTPRVGGTTPYGTSSGYSSSFPSAPLTAPIDFSLPRTPGIRSSLHDYSMPQMSAPIVPPHDFTHALHGSIAGTSSSRTPMRDTFGGGPLTMSQGQGGPHDNKGDEHEQEGLGGVGLKRKRSSFSLSQGGSHIPGSSQTTSQPYSSHPN
ncbi:hypothetical protein F5Y17DRAFT_308652 [Xylariaceae sp. FL0594]|nr:hypothetical protein F5Y17DRAFT_308652 [Xylariaceae sp. FL0594]